MEQKLQIMYTCVICGRVFYAVNGEYKTIQQMIDEELLMHPDYRHDVQDGFCVDCVNAIHFKET